jgi:transcriptional regulator with XRE-family HTH domain
MNKLDQNKFNSQLGVVVRKLREEQDISRLALAELSRVNEKYIGKIERGECCVSAFILKKIAVGLNTNISIILKDM